MIIQQYTLLEEEILIKEYYILHKTIPIVIRQYPL